LVMVSDTRKDYVDLSWWWWCFLCRGFEVSASRELEFAIGSCIRLDVDEYAWNNALVSKCGLVLSRRLALNSISSVRFIMHCWVSD
jgi:hypothetical protein